MAKQVYDLRSQAGISVGQSNEALRNYSSIDSARKKWGYFDVSRSHLNFEVRKGGVITPVQQQESIPKRFGKFLKKRRLEDPNELKKKKGKKPNVRTIAAIILGGSRDRMLELAFGSQKVDLRQGSDNSHLTRHEDIERWATDMYRLVCRQYGEENILSFIVHLDEKKPHVHCAVVPVDEQRNKISWHHVFGKDREQIREKWRAMHDAVAAVNARWGLERGDDTRITGNTHRTTEEYWLFLQKECERLSKMVNGFQAQLNFINGEIRRAEIKEKGLTTMIANKEQQLQDLEDEVNSNEYVIQETEEKIQATEAALTEKRGMLNDTKEQIQLLQAVKQQLLQQKQQLKHENAVDAIDKTIVKYASEKYTSLLPKIYSLLEWARENLDARYTPKFDRLAEEFRDNLPELSEEARSIAIALYTGGADGGRWGETAGGVGVISNNLRRKPDEDDDAWKYRCVAMACMTVKKKAKGLQR